MNPTLFNSYLEVDLSVVADNYRSILSTLPEGTELIPVIKCNAYGIGALQVAHALNKVGGVKTFALAQIREAVELREAGFTQQLIVMGGFPLHQIPAALENDITLTVFRPETAAAIDAEAAKQGKTANVQIKIETGLNRIGARPGEELDALARALKNLPNIHVAGAFTHFLEGEIPESELAYKQLELYLGGVKQLEDAGIHIPKRHICNSGASDWFKDAYLDAVRIGRRLYMDSRDHPLSPDAPGVVREAVSWRTSIINLRTVEVGETVGYDRIFTAQRPTTVATICIGYGDGLYEQFVKAGSPVLVNGESACYIGICMDQSFIDVTGIDCAIGDEVTIFGKSTGGAAISAQALAATVGHEGVYFTSLLSPRVERRYIK
ncbi:MAG: alanine racemase [Oscillospiraceae bacterium]|nr:alanine racemase [Oscillospiraceae bacterium]